MRPTLPFPNPCLVRLSPPVAGEEMMPVPLNKTKEGKTGNVGRNNFILILLLNDSELRMGLQFASC